MLRTRLAVVAAAAGLAAWPAAARGAVAFVDQAPVTLEPRADATATVELVNGNPRARDLTLRVLQAPEVAVTTQPPAKPGAPPATAPAVPPGGTAAFVVTLTTPPKAAAGRELLATSTDGTSARLALQ